MGSDLYDIWLTGLQPGQTVEQVTASLAKAFRIPPAQASRILARAPTVVKQGQAQDVAARYRVITERSGATCEIRLVETSASLDSIPLKPSVVSTETDSLPMAQKTPVAINQQPVFFEPTPNILFPKRCVRCFAKRPRKLVSILPLDTEYQEESVFAGQVAGFLLGGYVGAAIGGWFQHSVREAKEKSRTEGLVKEYRVPLCTSCDQFLASPIDSSFSASQEAWMPLPFLDIQYTGELTQLTFKHPYFAEAFRLLNQGFIRDNTWGIGKLSGALPAATPSERITQYAHYMRMDDDSAPLAIRLKEHLKSHWKSINLAVAPDISDQVELEAKRICGGLPASQTLAILSNGTNCLILTAEGLHFGRGQKAPRHCVKWSELGPVTMGDDASRVILGEELTVPWIGQNFPIAEVLALLESIRLGFLPVNKSIPDSYPLPEELWEIDAAGGPITSLTDLLTRYKGLVGLHVVPDIPPAKKEMVLKRCSVTSTSILALIDCTIGGSARDFVLVGSDYLYIRQGNAINVSIPLGESSTWEVSPSGMFNIRFSGYGDLAISKRKQYVELFRKIHQYTGCKLPEMPLEAEASGETAEAPEGKAEVRPTSLNAILRGYGGISHLYLAPEIPPKMVKNALKLCGGLPSRLLALIDCSVFGSAKKCILIFPDAVKFYFGPKLKANIPLTKLPSCDITIINGHKMVFGNYGSGVVPGPSQAELNRMLRLFGEIQKFAEG